MKVVLNIICWILVVFCAYLPFSYFHSTDDKKDIRISHILVQTEEEAQKIRDEIQKGKSFEEMASQYSLCPSKADKGDIGYNMRGQLIPEFEKVAFKLKLRELSNPVKTEQGLLLI
jgi:peptidyl-prolyl cis-trans isomerase C